MTTPLAYLWWITFLIPGYAIVRRWFPREFRAGMPAAMAVCFAASLAVFVPLAVAAFVLGWSSSACGAGHLVVLLIGLVIFPWRRLVGDARKAIRRLRLSVELIAVLLVWSVCLVSGSYLGGDGIYHIAKLRFLAEHNLSLVNPYSWPDMFDNRHHVCVWHFVLVSHAALTGTDSLTAWLSALPICRLALLGAIWRLTYAIFRQQRICAWAAVWVGVGLIVASHNYDQYPGKMANLILLPMATAYVFECIRRPRGQWIVLTAIVGLLLGAVHPAVPVFAAAVVSVSIGVLVVFWFRQRRRAAPLLGCAAALLCGLPFTLISYWTQTGSGQSGSAHAYQELVRMLPGGWQIVFPVRPVVIAPSTSGLAPAIVALIAAWIVLRRQRRFRVVAAASCLIACVGLSHILFPPVSTAWLSRLPGFILVRMAYVPATLAPLLAVGAVAVLVNLQARRLVERVALLGCLAYANCAAHGVFGPGALANVLRNDSWQLHTEVRQLRETGALCRKHVPPGEVVLAPLGTGYRLAALSDCRVIAVPVGHELLTLDDWPERHRAVEMLLAPDTPEDVQRTLLRRYDVRHALLPNGDEAMDPLRRLEGWTVSGGNERYTLWKWSDGETAVATAGGPVAPAP